MPLPFAIPLAWAAFKKVWWLLPTLAAIWFAYSWAYDRGVASQVTVIAGLTHDRDVLQKEVTDFKARVVHQNTVYVSAEKDLRAAHAALIAGITSKLNDADNRAKKVKVITKEVTRYVSTQADANCVIPTGFVRLHNIAASNTHPSSEASGVASGGLSDVDSPSGTSISSVATTVRDNYASCQDSMSRLRAWQEWYPKAKDAWDKAAAIINKAGE